AVERSGSGGDEGEGDRGDDAGVVRVPETDLAVAAAPTAATEDDAYARAIAAAYETAFDASLGVEFPEPGLVERFTP
ncbi:MAG: ParA family protein, partial [Methanobacteriota archaeon]